MNKMSITHIYLHYLHSKLPTRDSLPVYPERYTAF